MLRPFTNALLLFCILAAGCKTGYQSRRAQAPDWEAEEVPSTPERHVNAAINPATPVVPESAPVAVVPEAETSTRETWVPLLRWSKAHGLAEPARVTAAGGAVQISMISSNSSNDTFTLTTGSLVAHWRGAELRLGFAPVLIDGQPFVHRLDLLKTIQPLLDGRAKSRLHPAEGSPVVVIDPGHGGQNGGTRSVASARYEKDYTLDWARRLQAVLIDRGWNAILTRSNDFDLALSNRVAFTDRHRADLFLSLHFNSAFPDSAQAGLETYCLTPVGMRSTVTRGFSDEQFQTFPNNAFDIQNLQLAMSVHGELLPASGSRDRGVRRARFPGVLRNQHCPAILIEGGYLSNPEEARRIDLPAFRQKLAVAVANALAGRSGAGTAMAAPGDLQRQNADLTSPR